jgi:ERF superfamily
MSALAEALVAAQDELATTIPRDAQGDGYKYTTLDKLIDATRPILTKHGLSITQWPTTIPRGDDGMIPGLATRITHDSADMSMLSLSGSSRISVSESLEYVMPLYLTAKTMQGLGAAITYARRYAWASALGIASEEDTDAKDEIPF